MNIGRYFFITILFFLVLTLFFIQEAEAQSVCDSSPLALSTNAYNSFGRSGIDVVFSNRAEQVSGGAGFRRCFTHYNIRFAIIDHPEQQIEIDDSECSPYPSSSCHYLLGANLQKPYRIVIQGCTSRFLASSRCTAWSNPSFFLPYGSNTCKDGFIWREAFSNDHVCVTPETRAQAASDNSQAVNRIQPSGGFFGSDTCRQGFVWRQADRRGETPGDDHVCVTPEVRQQTWADNAQAQARRARP